MTVRGRWAAALRGMFFGCAIGMPGAVFAVETTLSAPGASEDLTDRLTKGSAVMATEVHGLDSPLELLSSSLSDYRTLVQILYDEGFFSPVVSIKLDGREAANINPLNIPSKINKIAITVEPGSTFRFGEAVIDPVAPGTELPETYAAGQLATTGAIRDAASAGILGWREAGHAKAKVSGQRVRARHRDAELDAQIKLLPGPQLTFGTMRISGTTDVKTESIERIAGFPSGEVYSPEDIQKVGTRLRRTGTFNVVSITEAENPNPDDTLDFNAEFEDQLKRQINFGLELSSRNGLEISTTWIHRNLMRGAERLRLEAKVRNIGGTEDIDGRIGFRLDRPDRLGPDDSVFYLGTLERRNRTHYDVTQGLLGIGARRTFSDDLYAEAWIGYNYNVADDAYGSDRKFQYIMLPFRTEWDKRDNKVSATSGFFLDARLTPFAGLSDTESGAQIFVDGRGYWAPGSTDSIVLAGRLQVGSVVGPSQSDVSPIFLFYSGGAGTVRGQPYESLGIPVGTGVAGGKSFLGASAEVRGKVTQNLSLVGFYDFGAVGTSSFITSDSTSHAGAGLGVRYDLGGFGPLRFDLAYPTSGPTSDGLQFYIGIGQAF